MKKPGTEKSLGKKKPAAPKINRLEEKRIEKYKKQSLDTGDEEEDLDELPEEADIDFPINDFDDFDDEDEDF